MADSGAITIPPEDPVGSRGGGAGPFSWVAAAAALLGAIFAGVSTADFIEHLDRQVHSIHCSFVPGAGADLGENGCRAVMMSPYSSVLRDRIWGGLPISLLALAVFAYLFQRAVRLALARNVTRRDTAYFALAAALPVLMSLIYGYLSMVKVGDVCKLCVGIYVSSAVLFISALVAYAQSPKVDGGGFDFGHFGVGFLEGCGYVVVMVGLYFSMAPQSAKPLEGCGSLVKPEDPAGIMLRLEAAKDGLPSIEVLDPLCPACRNFDARLKASGLDQKLAMQSVLFPLDSSCNWMVKTTIHPGACAVSEAMLCDREGARKILDFAFEHQKELTDLAKEGDKELRARLVQEFPSVKNCLGTSVVTNKLNKSLRWAVANALPVLTPQVFIGGRRVCDEDTDLGLEFTVGRLITAAYSEKGQ